MTPYSRPESHTEYIELQELGHLTYTKCVSCHSKFTKDNVYTPEGWAETQISGYCEKCFDDLLGGE